MPARLQLPEHDHPSPLRDLWDLRPGVAFLNHGSFGACPRPVRAAQRAIQDQLEDAPGRFFIDGLERRLDQTRTAVGAFVNAAPQDLAFVPNATTGVNAVLRSLSWKPGDELLATEHTYNACRTTLDYVAGRCGARVVTAALPFPMRHADDIVAAVLAGVTPRTRLALLDHVTSPTAVVMPIERLVAALRERAIETLVDGAHAPGMVSVDLAAIGPTYYTANCHKWMCAPKGAGFLYVKRDRQDAIRPVVISHGANAERPERSRFHLEFDWTGTTDPSAILSIPAALDTLGNLLPGGWPALQAWQHALVCRARQLLAERLGVALPCPDDAVGSMATLILPERLQPASTTVPDPLIRWLWDEHAIDAVVAALPDRRRFLRISTMIYNDLGEIERLAAALERASGHGART